MNKGEAREALDALGVEQVCDKIADGVSMTAIAAEVKVSIGSLITWIAADADRSARVREARASRSKVWDEMAEAEIRSASDAFELSKARELASHYRWRASKIGHKEYGDKLEVDNRHSGSVGFALTINDKPKGDG